jgi:hypothetical protein
VPTERNRREEAFERLIGHAVASATYMGAWTTVPSEPGAYVEWVELTTVEGVRFRITTEPDFGDFGLMLLEGPVDRSDALKIFDASGQPAWTRALRARIAGAKVLWRPLLYAPAAMQGELPEYPRDVVLTFEGGDVVVLSAASVGQDGKTVVGVDSVSAFTAEEARLLGILDARS